jgi:hypothetical protein
MTSIARQPCGCKAARWKHCLARNAVLPCSEWATPAGAGGLCEIYCRGCLVSERLLNYSLGKSI